MYKHTLVKSVCYAQKTSVYFVYYANIHTLIISV